MSPSCRGYLERLGDSLLRSTSQRRYYQLNGVHLCFGLSESSSLYGVWDVQGCTVDELPMHSHSFLLSGPFLPRPIALRAESLTNKQEWINALSQVWTQSSSLPLDAPRRVGEGHINLKDYHVHRVLGLGGFAKVLQVSHKQSGKSYAMKVMDKSRIIGNDTVASIHAERNILASINHPFICKLHRAFQTREHLILVMDFLSGGELLFHLQCERCFSESRARFYAAEIALGLGHLHAHHIAFRDLKPENVVLSSQGHATLTDFGLAKQHLHGLTRTFCGTAEYMAPEQLSEEVGHDFAVDWWALGILLFEMVHGTPPFVHDHTPELHRMIMEDDVTYPDTFSKELVSLLSKLLRKKPEERLCGGTGFRAHPFFTEIDFARLARKEIHPEFVPTTQSGEQEAEYFDPKMQSKSPSIPQLEEPCDPNEERAQIFHGFEFTFTRKEHTKQLVVLNRQGD